ncbi:hypothetical protein NFI96_008341 [Prochilodus magdalenae]|nr:hypothetical protein NFI96_008341 [Prochilodus magdalenae]
MYESLDCGFSHIRTVQESFSVSNVTWMKDCRSLRHTEPSLTFPRVTESDGGQYTCVVNFTHEGREYTAAETLSVSVVPGACLLFGCLSVVQVPVVQVSVVQVSVVQVPVVQVSVVQVSVVQVPVVQVSVVQVSVVQVSVVQVPVVQVPVVQVSVVQVSVVQVPVCCSVPQKPRVVRPQQERHTVTVGEPHVLNCTVFVGTDAEDPLEPPIVYWLVNSTEYPEEFSPLTVEGETTCTQRDSTTYCGTPLKILEVKPEFLHIPFTCFITNSKGTSNGTVILVPHVTRIRWASPPRLKRDSSLKMTRCHSESLHDSLSCVVQPSADGAALTGGLMEDTTARWRSVVVVLGQSASQSELHCAVGLLTACTAVVLGLLVFYFLKAALASPPHLAFLISSSALYLPHSTSPPPLSLHPLSAQSADRPDLSLINLVGTVRYGGDGKLYDAYVSYICSGDQSASSTAAFALRALPEVLEDRLGYRLFIRGRDDPPGAAVPDVISESVGKSRRLIIVLTPQTFSEPASGAAAGLLQGVSAEHPTINNNTTAVCPDLSDPAGTHVPNWGPYEWWVGLYDALVKEGLQVILIQVGEKLDEAQLPESLRYVISKQGVLRWKQDYSTKPGTKFWKQLHYRMPPVQRVQPGDVV